MFLDMYVLFYIRVDTSFVDLEEFFGLLTFVRNNYTID